MGNLLDFQVYSLERQLNLSVHSLVTHAVLTLILLPCAIVLNASSLILDFALSAHVVEAKSV